jgi:hypothetical protein
MGRNVVIIKNRLLFSGGRFSLKYYDRLTRYYHETGRVIMRNAFITVHGKIDIVEKHGCSATGIAATVSTDFRPLFSIMI